MKRILIVIAIANLTFVNLNSCNHKIGNSSRTVETVIWALNFNVDIPKAWKDVSIASRYNNPGNLRSVRVGNFRKFTHLEAGYYALIDDINYKQVGNSRYCDSTTTVEEFIGIYAPSFENDTEKYIRHLCEELNIDKTKVIGDVRATELARAIVKIEDPVLYAQMYVKLTYSDTIFYNE